jgi:signal transduction histidine kinase
VSRDLRRLVVALTVAALVMANVAVFVLLRTGQIILRPVDALVQGSRELARERFEHRVHLPQTDEFGELAHAHNRLAEQLQANEARKTEVLQHLAVALNHELNNVMSVIELQLGLLDRRSGGDPAQAVHLRQIRDNLARMTRTVAALKSVRRIVLTDYGPGQKMIDLARSADEPAQPARAEAALRGAL